MKLTARLSILALSFLGFTQFAAAAGTGADCARVADNSERLACYDAIFRDSDPIPAQADSPGDTAGAANTPEEAFGREHIERTKPPVARDQLEEITASVANIKRRARNELVVYLSNGQVWAQTSPRYLTLKTGDGVIVRRGRMGGYILTTERGGSTRVKRLR